MKKIFNLTVLLAALTAFAFTSCGEDEDPAKINVSFESKNIVKGNSAVVTITVDPEENLKSIELYYNGDFQKNLTLPTKDKSATSYELTISKSDLTEIGNYNLEVYSKTGKSKDNQFYVIPDFTSGTATITANGNYYYLQGTSWGTLAVTNLTATSVTVSLDGKTAVELSDADKSYLLQNGTASKKDGVTKDNFLLAKKNADASIVDNAGLTTPIVGAENVKFVSAVVLH